MSNQPSSLVINQPSDRNGCGYYRTILPFSYLTSIAKIDSPFFFLFNFDLTYLERANWLRFQRQVTQKQTDVILYYKELIQKNNFKTKLSYEIDDLVHEIEPQNILAYQFYTKTRKDNMIKIMENCDVVTMSTEFLKEYYKENFNINNIKVVPNYIPKFLWANCGKRDKYNKGKKLRILWAGSSSHVGKNGDLEFLIPLIEKTVDEFEWVFFGCAPFSIKNKVEFHEWQSFYNYPHALDNINADIAICPIKDSIFNYAKSDLKLLEYTALGLPGIYSSVSGKGPYDLQKDSGICLVDNDIDAWYNTIKTFEKDESERVEKLIAGQNCLEKRWLEDNIQTYIDIFGGNK